MSAVSRQSTGWDSAEVRRLYIDMCAIVTPADVDGPDFGPVFERFLERLLAAEEQQDARAARLVFEDFANWRRWSHPRRERREHA